MRVLAESPEHHRKVWRPGRCPPRKNSCGFQTNKSVLLLTLASRCLDGKSGGVAGDDTLCGAETSQLPAPLAPKPTGWSCPVSDCQPHHCDMSAGAVVEATCSRLVSNRQEKECGLGI